jgi:hypothetical protein
MSPFLQEAYDAATAAVLKLIQQVITDEVPVVFHEMIPAEKVPIAAAALAKTALDAAAPHIAPSTS